MLPQKQSRRRVRQISRLLRISTDKRPRFRRSTLPPRTTAASAPAGFPVVAAHPSNMRIGPGSATLFCRASKGEHLDGSGKPDYVRI